MPRPPAALGPSISQRRSGTLVSSEQGEFSGPEFCMAVGPAHTGSIAQALPLATCTLTQLPTA